MVNRSASEWFILAHSWYQVKEFGWQQAAQHSLNKIACYKSLPAEQRPPCMTYSSWFVIEEEIRLIAGGVTDAGS
ncbi:MAG: hypothetical protein NW224_11935 [Leptolyngbyaceae cyanobacterium bins.302]|nr:hypothetical protein [Leptolyngbyaceae cyanobacterium bins.302]